MRKFIFIIIGMLFVGIASADYLIQQGYEIKDGLYLWIDYDNEQHTKDLRMSGYDGNHFFNIAISTDDIKALRTVFGEYEKENRR